MGYAQYKELDSSGVSWLQKKPSHWRIKRLKFSTDLINNKVSVEDSPLPYLGLEHIESWTGRRIEGEIRNSEGLASSFVMGDVLFGKLRPYLAKVHLAQQDGLISSEALVVRSKDELDAEFLKYYMLSRDFINIVDSSTYGSKMPRASWDFIGNLPVLLPDVEEQKVIARFLDFKTAQIDVLISKEKVLLDKLAEKRTALISHAVTKGLDPSVPMKDSGVAWLGGIPVHWTISKLAYLSESLQTGPFGSQLHAEEYMEGGVPLINPTDISNGEVLENTKITVGEDVVERLSRHKLELGDIVIARRGEMGRAGLVRERNVGWLCGTGSLRARLNKKALNPEFLLYQFSMRGVAEYLSLQSVGSTMDNLNTSILGRLPVIAPPLHEQAALVLHLRKLSESIDSQAAKVGEVISSLQEYRSALITNAVTGKIDVRGFAIPQLAEGVAS
jgi:Restriction endonuclease S subunits